MTIRILFLSLLISIILSAFASPTAIKPNNYAAQGQPLYLDFKPDIVNPSCGATYRTQVAVTYIGGGDPAGLSIATSKFLNLLGGPKGKKDVDVSFICAGQPLGEGSIDNSRIKVVFFTGLRVAVDIGKTGHQDMSATLQITHEPSNFIVAMPANLGAVYNIGMKTTTFDMFIC